jgi:CysZ protein
MFGISSFIQGFKAPFRAAAFILKTPSVLALVAIPLAINFVLYVALFWYGGAALQSLVDQAMVMLSAKLPPWALTAADWFLRVTAWVSLLIVSVFTFTMVAGILAAPFNDILSRKTSKVLLTKRGRAVPAPVELKFVQSMGMEFKRTLILLGLGGLALIMGIIPLMQFPALFLGGMVLAFEYLGYVIAQRSPSLWTVWGFIAKNPARAFGFGTALIVLMALPLVGVVYIPLAVVGGTMLHDELLG